MRSERHFDTCEMVDSLQHDGVISCSLVILKVGIRARDLVRPRCSGLVG